jgi:hypothetical protein
VDGYLIGWEQEMTLLTKLILAVVVAVLIYLLIWAGDHFDDEV